MHNPHSESLRQLNSHLKNDKGGAARLSAAEYAEEIHRHLARAKQKPGAATYIRTFGKQADR
jgi:hypothetical protein